MSDLTRARALLEEHEEYTCVLCRGEEAHCSTVRGISPMLLLLNEGKDLHGASAADRIIGKAAAMLFLLARVSRVYGEVMTEEAALLLEEHGISASYGELVPHIINRRGDGICPMEQAVEGISDPLAAKNAIENTLLRLRGGGTE